jgi:Flp pilus assembly protein TadG
MNYNARQICRTRPHRGTTTVEFSIILPIFFLVLLGGMQIFRYTVVANTVETAVIEAARQGMINGRSDSAIKEVAKDVLDHAGLSGYTIAVNRLNSGASLNVQAELSLVGNGFLVPTFGCSWTVRRSCTLRCE